MDWSTAAVVIGAVTMLIVVTAYVRRPTPRSDSHRQNSD